MRHQAWLRQAEKDFVAALDMRDKGHHEWACFIAMQAAEKACKAYYYALELEPPSQQGKSGHDLVTLSRSFPRSVQAARADIAEAQGRLTRHSEYTRYPHVRAGDPNQTYVAPCDDYTEADSETALWQAAMLVDLCRGLANAAASFTAEAHRIVT